MQINMVLRIITIGLILLMLLCNTKVRVFSILVCQIQVFKNAEKDRISPWDILCFIVFPCILGVIIVSGFSVTLDSQLAGVLSTVFAFIFTVLFGFAAILVGKMDSGNSLEKQVVSETFVSIMTCNLLSFVSAIMSFVVLVVKNAFTNKVLSICIFSFSFMIIMLVLLISKRTFAIYTKSNKAEDQKDK